ncbi:MAG: RNA polymerase sigma factor [Planctomycetota bacterium]
MAAHSDLEPEVVRRARAGDAGAFEAVVRHFQHRVHALAYRLTYDGELARDITQEVFIHLYERFDRYDPARPFTPWFLRLATNYTLNARAKARLRRAQSLDTGGPDEGSPRRDPGDADAAPVSAQVATSEERARVRAAVRELPEKYAGVVVLHYLEGLGVKEIAERLDMPVGTVKIRLFRARDQLRQALRGLEEPPSA